MDDSMDGGGRTVPGATVEEVEPRREQRPRATQEQLPRTAAESNCRDAMARPLFALCRAGCPNAAGAWMRESGRIDNFY